MQSLTRLTSRDLAILADLNSWGVLSCEQLRSRHFEGRALSVASERLTKLHKLEVIRKQRVGILLHHGEPRVIGIVFSLNSKGLTALRLAGCDVEEKQRVKPLNTAQLYHDLLLVEVAGVLARRHPEAKILCGSHYLGAHKIFGQVPDLVMCVDGFATAVELELSDKSKLRYQQILANYRISKIYQKVLYVVGAVSIARKIRSLIEYGRLQSDAFGSVEKFTFTPLSSLIQNRKINKAASSRATLEQEFKC